jgi:hypothetical protein
VPFGFVALLGQFDPTMAQLGLFAVPPGETGAPVVVEPGIEAPVAVPFGLIEPGAGVALL